MTLGKFVGIACICLYDTGGDAKTLRLCDQHLKAVIAWYTYCTWSVLQTRVVCGVCVCVCVCGCVCKCMGISFTWILVAANESLVEIVKPTSTEVRANPAKDRYTK